MGHGPGEAMVTSLWKLLEMENLGHHPRLAESRITVLIRFSGYSLKFEKH